MVSDSVLNIIKANAREDELVKLCSNLVQIDSQNPDGDTRQMCKFIQAYLEEKGLPSQIIEPQPGKANLIASCNGSKPGRTLVLNGHLDTFPLVNGEKWIRNPFSG